MDQNLNVRANKTLKTLRRKQGKLHDKIDIGSNDFLSMTSKAQGTKEKNR